ncbi:phosphoglycerate mutase-like protein [Patellaria atrata CBS 101060]|uniref:Phosphoglycerate mutase-like protein n=1 Tax=Patellaria atrata CBS 101060 TaxID=1346257 RepID=A0A9P4S8F6_9PEZI|nr:phosphoglycerate mutase-like protein [Patellaria atrata CBS 101060]
MSDLDASTPRVFLCRHGETEWTKSGQYTGTTEVPLTPAGEAQVTSTGAYLVGPKKLIDPSRVNHIYVSPRKRAQTTFELLFGNCTGLDRENVTVTEDIAEWDYGAYEGMKVEDIREGRKQKGLDVEREWDIWRDGCEEGGESVQQVTKRLDNLISTIREIQARYIDGQHPADIVLVAHGLILRAFAKRWLKYPLEEKLPMMMSPGAIGVLSYKNCNINEPGFFIGLAIPSAD